LEALTEHAVGGTSDCCRPLAAIVAGAVIVPVDDTPIYLGR
jgi:hypothetical protein